MIFWMHIPKCAGKTWNAFFVEALGADQVGWLFGDPLEVQEDVHGLDGVRVLGGHLPWGVHYELHRKPRYWTMLRHPVDRVISHFFFLRAHAPQKVRGSLLSYIRRPDDYRQKIFFRNLTTRMLAGGEPDAELAIARLKEFELVTFYDRSGIEDAAEEVCRRLGIPGRTSPWVGRNNARPRMMDLRADELVELCELEIEDLKVWRWAREHFRV